MANQIHSGAANAVPANDVEQAAAATSGTAPTQVAVPTGVDVVRVRAIPGETIELPFPAIDLLARLGDGGNLAVKSDDVTVILLGYTAAIEQGEVRLIGSDHQEVDIAAVLAATDPAIDIQTAAGLSDGNQGDAAGNSDNTGSLFAPFDPQAGIGGFNGTAGLRPTDLQYGLVQRQFAELIPQDDEISPVVMAPPNPDPDPVAPVNYNDANAGAENQSVQNNVMIILDRSGSMNDDADGAGPGTQSRVELARGAIVDLIAKYDQVSDVRVLIVEFASNGQRMQQWGTPAEALAYIDGPVLPGTFTSYSDALVSARNGLADNDGKIPGAPVTVYFLSDGAPNADGANPGFAGGLDHSLTPAQMTAWNTALEANNVAHVYAVGIGSDIALDDGDLGNVADPNGNPNNLPPGDVMIVLEPTQLSPELQDTVAATTIAGNVLSGQDTSGVGDNGLPGAIDTEGAGAAFIHTFTHDGAGAAFDVAFAWDGVAADVSQAGAGGTNVTITGHLVSFDTQSGRMSFDFDSGGYVFVPGSVDADQQVTFHYGTTDSGGATDAPGGVDGDVANTVPGGADLVITVTNGGEVDPPALTAQDVFAAGTEASMVETSASAAFVGTGDLLRTADSPDAQTV